MLLDTPAAAAPRAAAAPELEDLELGRAKRAPEIPPPEGDHGGYEPPQPPPPRGRGRFPSFGGGDGHRLPQWQRLAIFGVMLFLSMLLGWWVGTAARVFARGLEAGRP